jgi:hypothetical protein
MSSRTPDASRQRSTRTQATAGVGCAGAGGGFLLGLAAFLALTIDPYQRAQGPRGLTALHLEGLPLFAFGGLLVGGLIGAILGRLAVFPRVRDCPPLALPGTKEAARRGLCWRTPAGFFLGLILGTLLSVLVVSPLATWSRRRGSDLSFLPLLYYTGPALGLFAGMTIGLIRDLRHGARAEARATSKPAVGIEDQ